MKKGSTPAENIVQPVVAALHSLASGAQQDIRLAGLKATFQNISDFLNERLGREPGDIDWLSMQEKVLELDAFLYDFRLYTEDQLNKALADEYADANEE